MGALLIDGLQPGASTHYGYQACYFKRIWSDPWVWVPWVRCSQASEQAGPEVGSASFEWNFGEIKQHYDTQYLFYPPVLVANAYTMVRSYNRWGNWATWIGVVQRETAHVHGTTWPQGDQGFEAFSIEHLLDRNQINGAYTESGFIERQVIFNRKANHGLAQQGNRSTSADANGVYYFSRDGAKWTNLQIIEYLLENFVQDGIRFEMAGAIEPLQQIIEEHNFYGQSVLQAINTLIDRRYGLNWRLLIPDAPGGTCYVYVFSQLAYPLQIGDVEVPANPVQSVVPIVGNHAIDPVMTFDALHQFDSVEVRGANILACGTFSYADATLVKGWTDAIETQYIAAEDDARRSDKYDAVYQRHVVARDWAGGLGNGEGVAQYKNAHPSVTDDGDVDIDTVAPFWQGERRFEREIPIEKVGLDADAPLEYEAAFAAIKHPEDNTWALVEKTWPEDLEFPAQFSLTPRDMGVMIKPSTQNHQYALNHFDADGDPGSETDPVFDYETLLVTAAFRTDAQLRAIGQVPGQVITETGRTKIIDVPEAEYWVILPNTVTGVEEGALVRAYADYEVVRDDSDRIKQILALALVWFGFARGTMTMTVKAITPAWPSGGLILGAAGTWHATILGTVVTKKRYVWANDVCYTEIITGSEELVFKQGVMKMKKLGIGGGKLR